MSARSSRAARPMITPVCCSGSRTARPARCGLRRQEQARCTVLKFRIFGARGGLEWFQEEPNQLRHSRLGEATLTLERGGPGLKPEAARATRTGIGHPEGYQEAFAVLYAEAAAAIVARRLGKPPAIPIEDMPTVDDGVRTMKFIEAALESSAKGAWVDCQVEV